MKAIKIYIHTAFTGPGPATALCTEYMIIFRSVIFVKSQGSWCWLFHCSAPIVFNLADGCFCGTEKIRFLHLPVLMILQTRTFSFAYNKELPELPYFSGLIHSLNWDLITGQKPYIRGSIPSMLWFWPCSTLTPSRVYSAQFHNR